jgi:chromosome condensin MukBEF MukE localization factor
MDIPFHLVNDYSNKSILLSKNILDQCAVLSDLYDKNITQYHMYETDEIFTNVVNILYYNKAVNNLDPASVLSQLHIKPNKVEIKFTLKIGSFAAQIFWTSMITHDETLEKVEKHKYSFTYLDEFNQEKIIDLGEEETFYTIENTGDVEEISVSQTGIVTIQRI